MEFNLFLFIIYELSIIEIDLMQVGFLFFQN